MKKYDTNNTSKYEQMGIASMIPGMVYMIERMQAELDEMRARLEGLQEQPEEQPKRPRGRPPKEASSDNDGWPTRVEVADILGVNVRQVDRWLHDGRLRSKKEKRPESKMPMTICNPTDVARIEEERQSSKPKPRKSLSRGKAAARYWANMTAKERSAEMQRRFDVRRAKTASGRKANAAKTRWERSTKEERLEWVRKMAAGRRKSQAKKRKLPTVRLNGVATQMEEQVA